MHPPPKNKYNETPHIRTSTRKFVRMPPWISKLSSTQSSRVRNPFAYVHLRAESGIPTSPRGEGKGRRCRWPRGLCLLFAAVGRHVSKRVARGTVVPTNAHAEVQPQSNHKSKNAAPSKNRSPENNTSWRPTTGRPDAAHQDVGAAKAP